MKPRNKLLCNAKTTMSVEELQRLFEEPDYHTFDLYKKHLEILEGISKYLWFAQDLLARPMSRKERSFSIWGREKLLDEQMARVKEVLRYNHLDKDFLNYYDTPEPFFEYHPPQGGSRTVLVIENKDTW